MKWLTVSFFAAILSVLTSCASHYRDTALYHSSGRAKPVVVVLPVIDSTDKKEYSWDLAQEFTTEIRNHVADSSRLYLLNIASRASVSEALNTPHVNELPGELLDSLSPAEFVLVSEIIDERTTPCVYKNPNSKSSGISDMGSKISLAVRVRVIDLRGKTPKVALQEVIYQDHTVPKAYALTDYNKAPWGSVQFANTAVGMAHRKLVRQLISHVEGYIGL